MNIEGKSLKKKKSLLETCDVTTLSSKLVGGILFFCKDGGGSCHHTWQK
jgi:hypothetical protein